LKVSHQTQAIFPQVVALEHDVLKKQINVYNRHHP
jgi:hypothetical protein